MREINCRTKQRLTDHFTQPSTRDSLHISFCYTKHCSNNYFSHWTIWSCEHLLGSVQRPPCLVKCLLYHWNKNSKRNPFRRFRPIVFPGTKKYSTIFIFFRKYLLGAVCCAKWLASQIASVEKSYAIASRDGGITTKIQGRRHVNSPLQ